MSAEPVHVVRADELQLVFAALVDEIYRQKVALAAELDMPLLVGNLRTTIPHVSEVVLAALVDRAIALFVTMIEQSSGKFDCDRFKQVGSQVCWTAASSEIALVSGGGKLASIRFRGSSVAQEIRHAFLSL